MHKGRHAGPVTSRTCTRHGLLMTWIVLTNQVGTPPHTKLLADIAVCIRCDEASWRP